MPTSFESRQRPSETTNGDNEFEMETVKQFGISTGLSIVAVIMALTEFSAGFVLTVSLVVNAIVFWSYLQADKRASNLKTRIDQLLDLMETERQSQEEYQVQIPTLHDVDDANTMYIMSAEAVPAPRRRRRRRSGDGLIGNLRIYTITDSDIPTPQILYRRHILPSGTRITADNALNLTKARVRNNFSYRYNTVFEDPVSFVFGDCEVGSNLLVASKPVRTIICYWRSILDNDENDDLDEEVGEWETVDLGLKRPIFVPTANNSFHFLKDSLDFNYTD